MEKKNPFKKINKSIIISTIIMVIVIFTSTTIIVNEISYKNKALSETIKSIDSRSRETSDWVNIYWGRIGYILEKMEDKRTPLKKSEINEWDLLYCGYHPNDYNFLIKAIVGNTYIWYKDPLTKSMEEMRFQDIVDEGCYIASPVNMMETEKE